ncbi:hybrid sensor histidine kinase/response regulator transcription factor [Flavivirga rizhaonensis]|uniref:histidine kinase n=1 Tax=Flavivirga rizhaonensis TaxID=2559571 RepID=A0A4S1DV48_9FLAO|nr:hybrid sensor histidine kinase/response regulator transcription factor [Flavivirga rizhaonensis]TGV01849.1 hybrid sensor histidine kinase/response regulator [Flavivirga rizhaonensis]
MPKRLTLKLFFIQIFFLCSVFFAKSQDFSNDFDKLNTRNGLSQSDVRAIYQDSIGYIWIGTYDGLNRYDGYSIKTFRRILSNPNSLRSNLISCITEDSYGNIWIGTDDQGLSMYERSTGNFFHYRNTLNTPNFLSDNVITALAIDSNGFIWAGTPNGLNKLSVNYKTGKAENQIFKKNEDRYGALNSERISCLFIDEHGNIWIGTSAGLSRYIDSSSNNKGQFQNYQTNPRSQVTSIQETSNSLIIGGHNLYDLKKEDINKANAQFNYLGPIHAYKILAYDDQTIWCATSEGVVIASYDNHKTEKIKHFTNRWGDTGSLSNDNVLSLTKDSSGIVWIGTNGGGVNIYKPNKKNFKHFRRNENKGSLCRNKIRSIFEDSEGNLWIGTDGGESLNYLSSEDANNYESGFKRIKAPTSDGIQSQVFTINELNSGNESTILLGIGYPSNFIYGKKNQILKGNFISGKNTMQPTEQVYTSLVENNNIVWLGTYHSGLYRYEVDENGRVLKETNFKHELDNPESISSNIIRSLKQDQNGNIWIGTANGLNKLSSEEKIKPSPNFIKYFHDENDEYSISHNYILPIFVSSKGQIWVGTLGGGLNKVITSSGSTKDHFLSYNTLDGLPNNVIKAILEDDNNNLWCSTNKGLTRFSPEKLEFQNFGLEDGLQDMEFTELAALKRASGEMLFGGINGFNAFYPKEILSDSFDVNLVFENLQILNETVKIGDTLNGRVILPLNINEIDELKLKHKERSFSIGFSTLHYAAPLQNKYAYKLEGFDSDWIYTSALNRIAKYTNLSPGKYKFKVKASNSNGHWSSNELLLGIYVEPPWWSSKWALLIYTIVFLGGLWLFRKFTIIKTTKKNEYVLEAMEKQKLEELSQLKLTFFTNISHEFRTPLTLIIGFIERLQTFSATLPELDRQKYYDKIFKNSKILLKLINQLIGFRKLEHGKLKLKVSYNDLTNFIILLSENFNEVANRKKIIFNVHHEQEIITWFDAEIIERVLFNLLSNAFKFTPISGKISVNLRSDNEYAYIEVEDSGKGIPNEIQEHIFERFSNTNSEGKFGSGIGLSFIKNLIEMHHGSISFKSAEGIGSTFKVILPMDKSTYSYDEISEEDITLDGKLKNQHWLLPAVEIDEIENKDTANTKFQSILLVEDNKDILYFLEETFKTQFNIYKAEEGQQAFDICLDNNIDLVISDIMMEGMDGYSFCKKLKSDDRINHIPIILLTAKNTPESKIKGYSLGAEAYVSKPFSLKELEARVEALLESRNNIIRKFKNEIEISPAEVGLTSIDERFINRVMVCIENNMSNSDFTVEMLARECGLGRMELNKKLKALVGFTTNAFIRNIRIKRAAQLLKRNMHSVSEIMYEVGFNDAQYFREAFKKQIGLTPSSYKKREAEQKET